jgi:hypothetical protein
MRSAIIIDPAFDAVCIPARVQFQERIFNLAVNPGFFAVFTGRGTLPNHLRKCGVARYPEPVLTDSFRQ